MAVKFVILGIGNIGSDYDKTRHNIGFDVVDSLLAERENAQELDFNHSEAYKTTLGGEEVVLMKPNTYVNKSGLAAKEILDTYELSEKELIVVVDDFNLAVETLRYRSKGSAGGHNGLKSLIEHCGEKFTRLRFGIGPLPEDESIIDFVLGLFSSEDREKVEETIGRAKESLSFFVENGLTATMNRYNG